MQAQAEHILVHDMCAGPKKPKPRPASGFYGVCAGSRNHWQAAIRYDSKRHFLGTFDTKQEAALAYDREVGRFFGGAVNSTGPQIARPSPQPAKPPALVVARIRC